MHLLNLKQRYPVMYNSHGCWAPLKEHFEIEKERGNATFNDRQQIVEKCGNHLAIWGTPDSILALKYALCVSDAEGKNAQVLSAENAELLQEILSRPIYTKDLIIVAYDGDNGYLLVQP